MNTDDVKRERVIGRMYLFRYIRAGVVFVAGIVRKAKEGE